MLDQVRAFLGQVSGGQRGEPPPLVEPTRPQAETAPLMERVNALGAQGLSPNEQFYRLAGRPPSPRELTAFNSRMVLEQQLGRPPTVNELRFYLAGQQEISPAYPRAFESR